MGPPPSTTSSTSTSSAVTSSDAESSSTEATDTTAADLLAQQLMNAMSAYMEQGQSGSTLNSVNPLSVG